jgi:hypothetical protein
MRASELAATTAGSPANCAGLHGPGRSRNTRPRRRTSLSPSREFIRPGGRCAGCTPLAPHPRERVNSPQQQREAPQTARGFTGREDRATPVREGGHRVFPAANSFARRPVRGMHASRAAPTGASELAATTAGSPANCAGLHGLGRSRNTRPRRRTSRFPSREFIRPAAGARDARLSAAGIRGMPLRRPAPCCENRRATQSAIPRERTRRSVRLHRGRRATEESTVGILVTRRRATHRRRPAADAQVIGTPHAPGPPSPRRRTLRLSSGEFIRSWRRDDEVLEAAVHPPDRRTGVLRMTRIADDVHPYPEE